MTLTSANHPASTQHALVLTAFRQTALSAQSRLGANHPRLVPRQTAQETAAGLKTASTWHHTVMPQSARNLVLTLLVPDKTASRLTALFALHTLSAGLLRLAPRETALEMVASLRIASGFPHPHPPANQATYVLSLARPQFHALAETVIK